MGIAGDAVNQTYNIGYGHSQCGIRTTNTNSNPTISESATLTNGNKGSKDNSLHCVMNSRTNQKCKVCDDDILESYSSKRGFQQALAGLSTGLSSHFWYIWLDRWMGTNRSLRIVLKKVFLDQVIMSPVNLVIYFGTLSLLEMSSFKKFREELVEKGMQNIFVVECVVWPPAQYFSFAVLPLKYRILWDNVISFGFDIYNPYVKYQLKLKSEMAQT